MNYGVPLVACTGGLKLGGSTTFLLNLGRGFRELGFELHVVTMEDKNEMGADFEAAGIPVHIVRRQGTIFEDRIRHSYLATAPLRPRAVLSCLGSESFEILRVVPTGTIRLGIIQSDEPGPYRTAGHFTPWLDAIVGVSESICGKLRSNPTFAQVQVEHIPYGISFGPLVLRPVRDISKPIKLIYVGRIIEEQKRISRLVELSRILKERGVNYEFTIAGTGRDLPTYQNALTGVEAVHFLGEVSNSQVSALLRSHDIFVLLSDYEGLPLSVLEAMGEGLVPVVSDLQSGIREAVTDSSGVRVTIGDVAAAADAVKSLAENPHRLAALSASAGESVRRQYSAARMGQGYLDLVGRVEKAQASWPDDVEVKPPMLLEHQWLYHGLARRVRRFLKSLRPG
jgi:glycosyltransferase involved in cell wall biosynthesis